MDTGKIYSTDGNNAVLVFGISAVPLYEGSDDVVESGIGVDLETGKIASINPFSYELTKFSELNYTQLMNFSHYRDIYNRMSNGGIVTISGKARSGKDTLANLIVKEVRNFRSTALANPIRDIHKVLYGKSDKKDRAGLIMIGQGLRKAEPYVWITTWLRLAIESFAYDEDVRLVVTDVRQPNEFKFFSSLGALTVLIKADEQKRREMLTKMDGETALDDKLLNDETESHVSTFDAGMTIFNNYDESYEDEMVTVLDRLENDEG